MGLLKLDLDQLSHLVIGSALRVHTRLGPGLFQSVYHSVLHRDLANRGLFVESNKRLRRLIRYTASFA